MRVDGLSPLLLPKNFKKVPPRPKSFAMANESLVDELQEL